MRHLALAVLLAFMLSGTARAGEIPSTGVVAPQPSSSVVTTGEISTNVAPTPQATSAVLEIILTLIGIAR